MRKNLSRLCLFLCCAALPSLMAMAQQPQTPKSMGRSSAHETNDVESNPISVKPGEIYAAPGQAALAMIHFPWQQFGFRISFLGARLGYRALTYTDERRIEIYVKNGEAPSDLAFDIAHELGHVVDLHYNTDERRMQWRKLRGIDPNTPWFGCSACSDYDTPAGDFAETFAYLLLGPGSYHSQMAPAPGPDQVDALAQFCHIDQISSALISRGDAENEESNPSSTPRSPRLRVSNQPYVRAISNVAE